MDVVVGLARAAHLASVLSLFGALLFRAWVAPHALALAGDDAPAAAARLRRIIVASGSLALATAAVFLPLKAAAMAGSGIDAFVTVIGRTRFGQVSMLELALVAGALALALRRDDRDGVYAWAAAVTGASLALQLTNGHGAALGGTAGLAIGVTYGLHLIAAGVWLGGLFPLLTMLRLPASAAAAAARRFSSVGVAAVSVLLGSAAVQAWYLVATLPGLIGTPYGQLCLLKLALLLAMLALAWINRTRLTPGLAGRTGAERAARWLRRSIAGEIALGGAILVAAGLLSTSAPAAHDQPWWPFSVQPGRAALAVPQLYIEAYVATYGIGIGIALALVSLPMPRARWLVVPLGLALAVFFSPGLGLFAVEAVPTSFWTSPTGFTASSVLNGKALFEANCASCHGRQGRGNGPAAAQLKIPPADLTAPHFFDHADGDLYWWLAKGYPGGVMPGFETVLEPDELWQIIDFLHANAAATQLWDGQFLRPVPAPDIPIACPGRTSLLLDDMAGRTVHLVFADRAEPTRLAGLIELAPVLAEAKAVSVVIADAGIAVPPALCVTHSAEAAKAYAEVSGLAADSLAGAEFLIDPARYLRRVWLPQDDPAARGSAVLIERIRQLRLAPVAQGPVGAHIH